MNESRGHPDRDDELGDEGLDRLLRDARWPEIPDESAARLRRTWRQVWPVGRGWLWRVVGPAAAAAVIVIALGAFHLLRRREAPVVTPQVPQGEVVVEPRAARASDSYVRQANPLEAAMMRRELAAQVRPDTRGRADRRIAEALERVGGNAGAAEPVAGELRLHVNQQFLEDRLAGAAAMGDVGQRRAAVRLLSVAGSERALGALLGHYQDPELRAAAAGGVARLADARTLARLAAEEGDEAIRQELLTQLMMRRAGQAAPFVLELLRHPGTAGPVAAALRSARGDGELAEAFLRRLRSARRDERLAAARALGLINGPVITRRLIEMAHEDATRREALYALLNCRGEEAAAFIAGAEYDPTLAAVLRGLRRTAGGPAGGATRRGDRT